jgi:hypothetical protein
LNVTEDALAAPTVIVSRSVYVLGI